MSEAPKKEAPKLAPDRFKQAEQARNHFVINVEPGHVKADMLDPQYWSMHSMKMSPCDLIEARSEDGTFWALFLVLACDRTWAKVHTILWCDLTTADVSLTQSLTPKFKVEYKGPQKKHCVIRSSDGAILFEGGARKADGEAWLQENEPHLT